MPKLDGVSATSLIRKFDPRTPIISMTSNSKPHDILYYFSQGMNDILPKPFTKEGLLGMLEKHLIHLKLSDAIRNHVPRGVGIPPLNDENFNQALIVSSQPYNLHGQSLIANSNGERTDQDSKANPLAGMGVSDDHYAMLMHNLAAADGSNVNGSAGDSNSNIPIFGFVSSTQSFSLTEKRPLDDGHDRDENKRGRFEVIE
jgi:osomolarity two-component system, response regulator SKN7